MSPAPRQGDAWLQRLLPLDEHVPLRDRDASMVLADLPRVFPADAGYQLRGSGPGQVMVSYTRRPTWALATAIVLALPTLGLGLLLLVARRTHRCVLQFAHEPTMTDPDQAVVHVTGELPADRWEMVQVVAGAVAHPVGGGLGGDPSDWLEPSGPGPSASITGMLGFGGAGGDFPGPRAASGPPPISPAAGFPGAYGEAPPAPAVGYPEPDPFDFQPLGEAEHTRRAPQRDLYGDLDADPPAPRHGREPDRDARPADDPFPPSRGQAAEPWAAQPQPPVADPFARPTEDPFPVGRYQVADEASLQPDPFPPVGRSAPEGGYGRPADDPFPDPRHQSPDPFPPVPPPPADPWPVAQPPGPPAARPPAPPVAAQPDFDDLFRGGPGVVPPPDEAPISRAPFALPVPEAPAPPPPAPPPFPDPAALLPGPVPGHLPERPAGRHSPEPAPDDPMSELPTRRARHPVAPEQPPERVAEQPEERTVLRSDALSAAMPAATSGEAMLEFDTGERIPVPLHGLVGRNPSPGFTDTDVTLLPVEDPDRSVSKTHLAIGIAPDGIWVMDRHSTNGVEVTYRGDKRKLKPGERVLVARGTVIKFGDRQLYLR